MAEPQDHRIAVHLDELLQANQMTLVELSSRVGVTVANLSILKNSHAKAIRFSTLTAICDALGDGVRIWLDAGFTAFAPMRALVERIAGLTRSSTPAAIVPVFGTETLLDIGAIAEASACGLEPILSLDYRGGRALGSVHAESAFWPSRVIVMTLDHVGAHAGPDLDTFASVRALAGAREVIGAGGIRHVDDLALASGSGAHAWLVASAIHDGTVARCDVHRRAFGR